MTLTMRDKENGRLGDAERLMIAVDGIMKNFGASLDDACRIAGSSIEEYHGLRQFLEDEEMIEV